MSNKWYRIITAKPDPKKQAAWDRYSRLGGQRPGDSERKGNNFMVANARPKDLVGPAPRVVITNRRPGDGNFRRWTSPGRALN